MNVNRTSRNDGEAHIPNEARLCAMRLALNVIALGSLSNAYDQTKSDFCPGQRVAFA